MCQLIFSCTGVMHRKHTTTLTDEEYRKNKANNAKREKKKLFWKKIAI